MFNLFLVLKQCINTPSWELLVLIWRFIMSFSHTWMLMSAGLQGPTKVIWCTKYVLRFGIIMVIESISALQASYHVSINAYTLHVYHKGKNIMSMVENRINYNSIDWWQIKRILLRYHLCWHLQLLHNPRH